MGEVGREELFRLVRFWWVQRRAHSSWKRDSVEIWELRDLGVIGGAGWGGVLVDIS